LDTLATAYYLNGEIAQAVEVEQRALALLPASSGHGSGSHLRESLEANLARFRRGLSQGSSRAPAEQARAKQP
jgi:hypothetical protein